MKVSFYTRCIRRSWQSNEKLQSECTVAEGRRVEGEIDMKPIVRIISSGVTFIPRIQGKRERRSLAPRAILRNEVNRFVGFRTKSFEANAGDV